MKDLTQPSPGFKVRDFDPALVLWSFFGALLILLATVRFGIGLSPDSVGYLSVARNIAESAALRSWDGGLLIVKPPLYPLALSGVQLVPGLQPLYAAALLNAVLFAATLFLAGRIALNFFGFSPLWKNLFMAALLMARPLFLTGVMAWSETLFQFWVLVFVSAALAWRENRSRKFLILCALAAAAATMTRYIGVTVIAAGATLILWEARRRVSLARLLDLALFLALAAAPFFLWILRNHALSGTWMGPRSGSGFSLHQNLIFMGVTILCWYAPLKEINAFAWLKKIYAGFAAKAVLTPIAPQRPTSRIAGAVLPSASIVLALFILFYIGLLIYSSTTVGYDQISDRLLAPVYIPLTLLLFAFLNARYPRASWRSLTHREKGSLMIWGVLVLLILIPGAKRALHMATFMRDGVGAGDDSFGFYNSRPWRESGTMAYLREHSDPGARIYSNSAPAIYQWTGRRAVPLAGENRPAAEWLLENAGQVAWFKNEFRETRDPEGFFGGADWKLVAKFKDGAVYQVQRKAADQQGD